MDLARSSQHDSGESVRRSALEPNALPFADIGNNGNMQVTAKIDYALRALVEMASRPDEMLSRDDLAQAQSIPTRYLESILLQLRQSGLVMGRRCAKGGYVLGRAALDISVADVSRSVDGPLAMVQGVRPEQASYEGSAVAIGDLWVAVRAAMRSVMEHVTIQDLVDQQLPGHVQVLVDDPDAWIPRSIG